MKRYGNLYEKLCSFENLECAFRKARKHKTTKDYVIEFEKNLEENLLLLRSELLLHSYKPQPLKTFILRDPKTRKISKSAFRDRVVHHALCNIIEPIFEKQFIYDSYANRKGKGTLKAVERFDFFKRKISNNNTRACYILKADIRHYFETVSHETLLSIIRNKIKDEIIIRLIKTILQNYKIGRRGNLGMPLGNLTSQFFANVYLNELDQFIKNELKVEYYIRYVDDFVILHENHKNLEKYKEATNKFLTQNLKIELHPEKSKIIRLDRGINLLGYRVFYYYKLLRKSNIRKFEKKFNQKMELYRNGEIIYEDIINSLRGWLGYAMWANTYKLRTNIIKIIDHSLKIQNNKSLII
ncbi:group II intron reverse transcriptase domain-containing protein [Candidatus Woesearchaeota archaeon]|nr:group II intron reverse transcriptase domain-containing protein [Candidatus Woesearchaeota archaeon]